MTALAIGSLTGPRASALQNMRLQEVIDALDEETEDKVIMVESHKTSAKGGAYGVPIDPSLVKQVKEFRKFVRPNLAGKKAHATMEFFFFNTKGKKVTNVSDKIIVPVIKKAIGKHVTLTSNRKFLATEGLANAEPGAEREVAKALNHSSEVFERSYKKDDNRKNALKARRVLKKQLVVQGDDQESSSESSSSSSSSDSSSGDSSSDEEERPVMRSPKKNKKPNAEKPAEQKPKKKTCAKKAWGDTEVLALFKGIVKAEKAGSMGTKRIPWKAVLINGGEGLAGRLPMQLKDKARNFTKGELELLEKMRDEENVAPEQRRSFKPPKRKAVAPPAEEPASKEQKQA